jgi:hypothetical protein
VFHQIAQQHGGHRGFAGATFSGQGDQKTQNLSSLFCETKFDYIPNRACRQFSCLGRGPPGVPDPLAHLQKKDKMLARPEEEKL